MAIAFLLMGCLRTLPTKLGSAFDGGHKFYVAKSPAGPAPSESSNTNAAGVFEVDIGPTKGLLKR
jgi:hypothetical protein